MQICKIKFSTFKKHTVVNSGINSTLFKQEQLGTCQIAFKVIAVRNPPTF